MTIADHCQLTVHQGRTALRMTGPDGLDVIYPLTAPEAAAIVRRLAVTLQQYVDRIDQEPAA